MKVGIIIEFFADNKRKVTDWGRGVPFGKKEDGTESLSQFIQRTSGGSLTEKNIIKWSPGQNGIGFSVALSSSFFEVKSRRW